MRPMVSIIVPVYNAEQYLRRCVDSILNQEYTDFEVFLVNDGSTDSSGDICEEYGNKDTRVIVIQKENTGKSPTVRNLALDRARGKISAILRQRRLDRRRMPQDCSLRAAGRVWLAIWSFQTLPRGGRASVPKGDIEEEGVLTQEEFAAHMMENPADFTMVCCGTNCTAGIWWRSTVCEWIRISTGVRIFCSIWNISVTRKYSMPCMPQSIIM